MKKYLFLIALQILVVVWLNSQGIVEWQSLLGGILDDDCRAVRETSDGSCIIFGSAYSSANGTLENLVNNGLSDSWIVRVDRNGNPY